MATPGEDIPERADGGDGQPDAETELHHRQHYCDQAPPDNLQQREGRNSSFKHLKSFGPLTNH